MRDLSKYTITVCDGTENEYYITEEQLKDIDLKDAIVITDGTEYKTVILKNEATDEALRRIRDEKGVRKTKIYKKLDRIETEFTTPDEHLRLDYFIYTLSEKYMNHQGKIKKHINKLIKKHKKYMFNTMQLSNQIEALLYDL